jgi:potassium-transporting ATPase KdpC subunit
MGRDAVSSILAIVAITLLCGLAYPLVVTGVAQVAFHDKADGSRIERDGELVGSRLLAQDFRGDVRYFQPRPSTATGYDPAATAFTNLGPNRETARETYERSLKTYVDREHVPRGRVPIDAVTSSASGVDPHISKADAAIQARRVAAVRRLPLARVRQLIDDHTDGRFLGVLGEPGVNVLELNLSLDRLAP